MLDLKRSLTLLVLVVALGGVLRFSSLGTNSFTADEFLDMNSAYGYHQTGEWKAWDFNFGKPAELNVNDARDERAFLYKWQVASLFGILPPTEAAARSVSVVWGLLSILAVYWATLIFTARRELGLVAALLCALSVSALIFSRRLRMYAMFFPLYLVFATTLYAAYEREYTGKLSALRTLWQRFGINGLYLPLAIVFGVASLFVHQLTIHLPVAFGVYLLIQTVLHFRTTGNWRNKYGYSVAIGLGGIILAALLFPKLVRVVLDGFVFFDDHYSYFAHALNDFATPVFGTLLIALGLWSLIQRTSLRSSALYLGAAYLVPLFMAVFLWRRNVGPQYIYFIQSFGMILAAAGIWTLYETILKFFSSEGAPRKKYLIFALILVTALNLGYFFEENNTYHETSTGGNPNYRKVFAYVKKEKQADDVLITRNFRNYYWSGAKLPVFDFGGELSDAKLSLADIQKIESEHVSGWFIYSGNDEDYISSEVEQYVAKNWERVSNANVRGDISVYRFGMK